MAAWLIQALKMLGVGAATGIGFEASQSFLGGPGTQLGPPLPAGFGGRMFEDGVLIPKHPHKRRRRRRALTASDRADIAFIAGTLDKGAGKAFAVQLAARAR